MARQLLLATVLALPVSSAEFPRFEAVTIDAGADKVVYAVTIADVNNDKKPDIVALTDRACYWYAAPDWNKHTIIADQTPPDNVCIATHDIDRDGKVDFAIGAGWTKKGTIHWVSRGKSLDDNWQVHSIGEELWLHRMRFADVLSTGQKQLVISPLNKSKADGARLTAFEIPKKPKTDRWKSTVVDASMNRTHNHWHTGTSDRHGGDSTFTASAEGIHVLIGSVAGWKKFKIALGADGKTKGAGEVKSGKLKSGRKFIATVEPMHGTTIAVYLEPLKGPDKWQRTVLDDTLKRGHAVWVANLDDDADDEVIVGHSDVGTGEMKGPGVYVFDRSTDGKKWTKHAIDNGGIATEDAVAADLNGDGRIDIVAGGRKTHNVKLYINRSR